jgi:hypothetical protein
MIDSYERLNIIHNLIDNERYFMLHAPRQTVEGVVSNLELKTRGFYDD